MNIKPWLLLLVSFGTVKCFSKNITHNPEYTLNVYVDPEHSKISVTGEVAWTAEDKLDKMRFFVSSFMKDISFKSKNENNSIKQITSKDTINGSIIWELTFVKPIEKDGKVIIDFSYFGQGQVSSLYYIGPEVCFGSSWGTDWYPSIDIKDNKAIGKISYNVPQNYTAVSTGNIIVENSKTNVISYKIVHPTYFAFAVGKFIQTKINGSVPVTAYTLKPHEKLDTLLAGIEKIFSILTREFGDYPFKDFTIIEIPREIAQRASFNGVSNQGMIFLNHKVFDVPGIKYVLNLLSHEFSHQWFPHAVSFENADSSGRYMSEALAEYGALRVTEEYLGLDAAEKYRRSGFEFDPNYSAWHYFDNIKNKTDHQLSNLPKGLYYRNIAYTKGFLVWDMLSREAGRQTFQKALHQINKIYAFKEIAWTDFLNAIERYSGKNLSQFYHQWFERTGAPEWKLEWNQSTKNLLLQVHQTAPFYHLTLELLIEGDKGERLLKTIKLGKLNSKFSFLCNFKVTAVGLDPSYKILHWTEDYRNIKKE